MPASQPTEPKSEGYQPPAEWRNESIDQIPPFEVEDFDPLMLSTQTPYQWQGGFIGPDGQYQASSVDQPPVARVSSWNKMDIESPQDDNFLFQQQYGSMLFDSEEFRARAKKMAADVKFGSPGHSRVQGVQRIRRHPPSQPMKSIYSCPDIAPTSVHKLPQAKELLPATTPSGCFPDARGMTEGGDVWWHADTTSSTKSRIPQDESFAEDSFDM
ncbi:MAG: hypothetical protein Q9188_006984 [Gyalolechia gomerana]